MHVFACKVGPYKQGHSKQEMLPWALGPSSIIYLSYRYTPGIIILVVAKLVCGDVGLLWPSLMLILSFFSCNEAKMLSFECASDKINGRYTE